MPILRDALADIDVTFNRAITYYVDGSTGSDDNDGLSWATAFKTTGFLNSVDSNAIPRHYVGNVKVYIRNDVLSTTSSYHTVMDDNYGDHKIILEGVPSDYQTGIVITGQDNTPSSITYHSYLQASAETWTTNELRGKFLQITSGTGSTDTSYYPIIANTATQLETYAIPDTDGTTVIKIIDMPKLKGALVSAPTTLVSYSGGLPFQIKSNNIQIEASNIDFSDVKDANQYFLTSENTLPIRMTSCSFGQFMSSSIDRHNYFSKCMMKFDTFSYFISEKQTVTNIDKCCIYSTDSTGYGTYMQNDGGYITTNSRFNNQLVAISSDGKGDYVTAQTLLFDNCDTAFEPTGAKIRLNAFGGGYINFDTVSKAVSLSGAKYVIGSAATFQGTGVTTEVIISDEAGDTASFSDLNSETTIRNTATGGEILYINSSTFLPIQNVEYDNTTSGLTAVNFQDAIDEIASGAGGGTQVFARKTDAAVSMPATIIFNTEDKDTESEYNNTTGIFTAGSAGRYLIVAHAEMDASSGASGDDRYLSVYKNTNDLVAQKTEYHFDANAVDPVVEITACIDLAQNDTIEIYAESSDTADVLVASGVTDLSITKVG